LFFYSWWDPRYLGLIGGSIAFNYAAGTKLLRLSSRADARLSRSWLLGFSVGANLALLAVFKYADFFLTSANEIMERDLPLLHIALPLGISFFTFTQIAFLVDAAKGQVESLSPVNYALFVSFFPHLIAGPILHHREMMPQFEKRDATRFNVDNFALGLYLLCIGLIKKLAIADQFAPLVNVGFEGWRGLDGAAAWLTSLSYTIQLYFDFSGYTDMALGLGWMFNIRLPQNFDSPYKAANIQDFWRRWHITLSRFMRNYLYIPLGGNHGNRLTTLRNLFLTFLLGGLWHGAGWTFVLWGALHGAALVMQRVWTWLGFKMTRWLAWTLTFLFVNVAWVYFRARSVEQANGLLLRMLGFYDSAVATTGPSQLASSASEQGLFGSNSGPMALVVTILIGTLCITWLAPNSIALAARFRPSPVLGVLAGAALAFSILTMRHPSEFLYFIF
jgi:D-alanyl-lipoteichoic acid acyltransferase DltB (MBOAT superfamily)